MDTVTDKVAGRTSEPMSVRYSEARLESTAQVKRLCISAVLHVHRWAAQDQGQATWEHVAGCIKSIETLEANTRRSKWGAQTSTEGQHVTPFPEVHEEASSSDGFNTNTSEGPSASATSSEANSEENGASSTDEDRKEEVAPFPAHLLAGISWVAPLHSKRVHIQRAEAVSLGEPTVIPLCRVHPYVVAYESGTGVVSAAELTRSWCRACLQKFENINKK